MKPTPVSSSAVGFSVIGQARSLIAIKSREIREAGTTMRILKSIEIIFTSLLGLVGRLNSRDL